MAKDPAFLFYPGDWLGGTMSFTRSHKGAYMDLLMCQFNQGHMSLQDVQVVLGEVDFNAMWESKLKAKFVVDIEGRFYNEKLETEVVKRRKFTESRKKNLNNQKESEPYMAVHIKNNTASHMDGHMENENENTNDIVAKDSMKGREGLEYVPWFTADIEIPANTLEAAERNQHSQTGNANTAFVKDMWKIFIIERLADPPIVQMQHKNKSDLSRYFLNFIRPKFPKKNGQRSTTATGQETEFDKF
jgi:uncharacterized protein YdaU (DUF1376 family)